MGKVTNEINNLKISKKRRTQRNIKPKAIKPVVRVTVKRLANLKRRIRNHLAERYSWEVQNKQLSNNLRDEKLANASLQKELFECRKLHHEAIISLNSYKMKQQDIKRTIGAYKLENNPFPHLIAVSQWLTNNKLRFDKLNTLLSSEDQDNVSPRQIEDSSINYYYKKSNKLTESVGRVGPRVKGLLISKPQIMLERVMLPHTNDPDPDSQEAIADTSTQEHNIPLSPIQEEQQDEEIPLRQISFRKKKTSRLGQNARRDKSTENSSDSHIPFDLSNASANSSPLMNRMEPVARLRDVSRLLHNSSIMQIDSGQLENVENSNTFQETEGSLFLNSHSQKPSDDPLEGCSWMTDQNYRSSMRKSRFTHVSPPSDSSDDDDLDCLPAKMHNTSYTSPLQNPLMNSTANSSSRMHVVLKGVGSNSPNNTGDTLNSSPNAEPDSTSQPNLRGDSSKFNLSPSTDQISDSNSISAEYSFLNIHSSIQQRKKNNAHHQLIGEGIPIDVNYQLPEVLGKRKRKPKNHAYPGEGDVSPKMGKLSSGRPSVGKRSVQGKVSIDRKSLNKNNKSSRNSTSAGTKANLTSPKSSIKTSSRQSKRSQNTLVQENLDNTENTKPSSKRSSKLVQEITDNKKNTKPSSKRSSKLVQEITDNKKNTKPSSKRSSKLVQEITDNKNNTKPCSKRSSKLSQIITPRNSEININSHESIRESDDHSSVRSRRNKTKVSYKESPLNVKLRRN